MRAISHPLAATAAALLTVGALAAAPASAAAAPASDVLTVGAPGGAPVNPGDLLTSSLPPGSQLTVTTVPGGSTGLFCQQASLQAQVQGNPAAPGTAVLALVPPFSIASCKSSASTVISVPGVSVAGLPVKVAISDSSGFPINVGPLQIVVSLNTTTGPVTCTYVPVGGAFPGNSVPGASVWDFTSAPFSLTGGTLPACGASVDYLSASFAPVIDTALGGQSVFVN